MLWGRRAAELLLLREPPALCFPREAAPMAWGKVLERFKELLWIWDPSLQRGFAGAACDIPWGQSRSWDWEWEQGHCRHGAPKALGQHRQSRESWEWGKSLWWHRKAKTVLG